MPRVRFRKMVARRRRKGVGERVSCMRPNLGALSGGNGRQDVEGLRWGDLVGVLFLLLSLGK